MISSDRATPELVIFDCDGVLVDSETIAGAVLARQLTTIGLQTTPEQARHLYQGVTTRDTLLAVAERLRRPLPPGWREQLERAEETAFRAELQPTPAVVAALRRIRSAGIPRCVASQGTRAASELKLSITGLREFFPAQGSIFSGEQVPHGKPDPDLFLLAASSNGVEPARCVVIEDTPTGATAGVAAGMPVLGYVADPFTNAAGLEGAGARLFGAMTELPRLLGLDP